MFCRACGTENMDGSQTCISCGQQLANPYQGSAQVGTGMPQASGPKPENYLVHSILATLCCCLPLGIVAIVYAAQVDSKYNSGDYSGAVIASNNAKKWGWIAFGLGLALNAIVFILQIVAAAAAGAGGVGH
jgi:hypothetical protein